MHYHFRDGYLVTVNQFVMTKVDLFHNDFNLRAT